MARDPLDRDYTPTWAAEAMVQRVARVLVHEARIGRRDDVNCPLCQDYGKPVEAGLDPSLCTCGLPRTIWEPHAGRGVFVAAARQEWTGAKILATDIDENVSPLRNPECAGLVDATHFAHLDVMESEEKGIDLVLGNPPFRVAEEHLRHLFSQGHGAYAFLLRLGFMASKRRIPFFREHPVAQVHVFCRRPSFRKGGTDSQDYALMMWGVHPTPTQWITETGK